MKEAPEHHEESNLFHAPGLDASFQGFVPRPLLQGHKMAPPPDPRFGTVKPLFQACDHTRLSEQPLRGYEMGPGHC